MTTADEAVHQLSRLKGQGYRIYYFIPDFSSTEAIWRKVFRDYLRTYGAEDKVALYLDLGQGASPSELDELIEILSVLGAQAPLVLVGESRNDVFRCILQQVDVLITTQYAILCRN